MIRQNKLMTRFLARPKDLTWDELVSVLNLCGYQELQTGKTGGSRRKFIDGHQHIISLHKPHPKLIVKSYVINQVIDNLTDKGKLKYE